jgi:prolyl oligopeptidase
MDAPPDTPERPVTDDYHGDEVVDPYRWLEGDDEDVQDWIAAQNEYVDAVLDTDAREALRPRFEALAEAVEYETVTVRGGRYFQRIERGPSETARGGGGDSEERSASGRASGQRPRAEAAEAGDDHPVLTVREAVDADRRVLVNPNEWDGPRSMDWFVPSLDGALVAYGVAEGGDEQYDVVVLDVDAGEEVLTVRDAGRTGPVSFAWTDGGFYYGWTGSMGDGRQLDKAVRYRRLDGGETTVTDEFAEREWPRLHTGPDGETVLVGKSELSGGDEVFVLRDGDLRPVVGDDEATFTPHAARDAVYVETEYGAPRGRVLRCPLDRLADGPLDPDDLETVVPEGDGVLRSVTLAGEHLVAHHHVDAHSRLTVHDRRDPGKGRELSLPGFVAVDGLSGNPDAPECFYRVQGFDRPPSVARADLDAGSTRVLDEPDVPVDVDVTVKQHWFESADGTEVPAFVAHRKGRNRDGDNPAVVYGYGGFRINLPPGFDRFRLPFFADGGVWVQVNARGGAEFGEAWHRAAMRERKQRTFDDFLAAAEGVVDAGYTRPERLACWGGSNGGLTVGAAVTQRPDLFRAAIAAVPLEDMLRFHEFLIGEAWTTEYGSPDDPDAYEYIRAYSPYHNVEARGYPATLFTTGAGDSRVHPAHARKMAARMQAAQTADRPVLLRTRDDTGHGTGKPTSMLVAEKLDEWGFVYDQLGVEV